MPRGRLSQLQAALPYQFSDEALLQQALTHSSFAHECQNESVHDNERLEFLGDAVLETVTSDYLYRTYPDEPEGALSKRRVALVCEQNLDRCARLFSLQDYLRLGRGEEKTGGRKRASVVSDAMEALIGAVYLDGGYAAASEFVEALVLKADGAPAVYRNDKSALQEYIQGQRCDAHIEYRSTGSSGPDHNRTYYVSLYIDGQNITSASGRSKKAAEQKAAHQALAILQGRDGNSACI